MLNKLKININIINEDEKYNLNDYININQTNPKTYEFLNWFENYINNLDDFNQKFKYDSYPLIIDDELKTVIANYKLNFESKLNIIHYINNDSLTLEVCKKWVENGGDINIQNNDGITMLINACSNNQEDIVYYLLDNNADINLVTNKGNNTLLLSDSNFYDLLLNKGIDINHKNINGETVLLRNFKYPSVIKFLIEKGADINVQDNNGWSISMHVINYYFKKPIYINIYIEEIIELLDYLIEHGHDINLLNNYNNNLFMMVCSHDNLKLYNYLIEKNINKEQLNIDGLNYLDLIGNNIKYLDNNYILNNHLIRYSE